MKFLLTKEKKNRTEITRNRWQSHPNSATKKIETKLNFFNLDTFTIDFKKNAAIDCFAGEIFGAQKENFGNLQSL